MFDKLEDLLIRFEEILSELNEPTVVNNQERFRKLMKEQNDLQRIVDAYTEYEKCKQSVEDSLAILEEESDEEMRELAKTTGAKIEFSEDIAAVDGADAIYTDVWVSMGEEAQFEERIKLLTPYRVTMDMMNMTHNPDCIFLHCLPSFHDLETSVGREIYEKYGVAEQEVTDEVFRAPCSKVFDEAENRMHTIKAVMVATAGR